MLKDIIEHKDEPVSINEIMSKFNVVHQTARTDLLRLTKLGFLSMGRLGVKMYFTYEDNTYSKEEAYR